MHGSKLSEFIQSDVPSNTLLLIPNEFGTVFELGVQRLETLEELEIQHSQALAKPERETNSHNLDDNNSTSDCVKRSFNFPVMRADGLGIY